MKNDFFHHYQNELMRMKNLGQTDFIEIYYQKRKIVLKLVDTSDETVKLMSEWRKKGYAEFYSNEPIVCQDPDLTQVFTKPSRLTGVIYEFINREGVGFCKDSVKRLMESTERK